MAELLFFTLAHTLPFHLFAYVPFWNHLRFSKRITAFLLIAEQLLYMGMFLLLVHAGFPRSQAQFIAIPIYGALFFFFVKMDWGKIAFLYIFTTDYLMTITAVVSYCGDTLGGFRLFSWQAGILVLILFFLTLPFMLRYICRTSEMVFDIYAPGIWKTIWLLPLFTSVIVMIFTYPAEEPGLRSLLARILLMLCMFLIYYHILLIIRQFQKQAAAEEQARSLEHLIQIQAGQYAMLQSRMEETKRARHDLRQHWAALKGCIDSGDQDALADYITHYGESLPIDSHRVFCKNYAVDSLLNFYAEKVDRLNISMAVSFQMDQKTMIPEPEFCVLLGNLLENALDACTDYAAQNVCAVGEENRTSPAKAEISAEKIHIGKASAGKNPAEPGIPCFIRVNARQTGESMLSLAVDNTCLCPPQMEGEQFRSSKHEGFGVGTMSVRLIARRYHGDARFEWKDGVFYASVMLNP